MAELDAIRAFAAVGVILYHSGLPTAGRLTDLPVLMGWTSVDLFFQLSGFLITSILLSHHLDRAFLGAFYARRALRIWPIYYLTIVVMAILSRSGVMPPSWPPFTTPLILHYLTFTQAIPSYWGDPSAYYHPIGHLWSVAVEEQFYLLWPFLILLLGRRSVVPIALILIVAAIVCRQSIGLATPHVLLMRCDGLGYGALLAILASREDFGPRRPIYAAGFATIAGVSFAILAAWTLLVSREFFLSTSVLVALNPIFLGMLGLVVCFSGKWSLGFLRIRWICYLGKISYGLYVYHYPIYAVVDHCLGNGVASPRFLLLKLGLTLAIAVISWELLEKPILAWKDRFPYSRGGETRPPASDRATPAACSDGA